MRDKSDTFTGPANPRSITTRQLVKTPGLTRRALMRAVRSAIGDRPTNAISVVIADDATLASLHERYLNDPAPTDVLAFDLAEPGDPEGGIDGEIVVSADAARRVSSQRGVPAIEEVLRYVIHGALHLCGMTDAMPAERRRMRREEDRVLAELAETTTLRRSRQASAKSKPPGAKRAAKRRR